MIKEKLKRMLNDQIYAHSLSTCETALDLARRFGASEKKVELAALLHDCAKSMPYDELIYSVGKYKISVDKLELETESLLHAPVGSKLANEFFGITDPQILNAIRYHTTAAPAMSGIAKIVYVADFIELARGHKGVVDARKAAEKDIDRAMLFILRKKIPYLVKKKVLIHPRSVKALNWFLEKEKKK
ncbi:bis(5'-nucleosyl)-tetraphosphatase (symmetrical) YqeK [bacterium]|nr:bis(5'-nucleosyl)-tetraphosphatase (symmetrical) YqeK [bacterium]